MYRRIASIVLVTILAGHTIPFAARGAALESDQEKKQESAKKKTEQGASLTGCVDEQDGQYVLVNDRDLTAVASLVAEGFKRRGLPNMWGTK
jgi:hypothetical protein